MQVVWYVNDEKWDEVEANLDRKAAQEEAAYAEAMRLGFACVVIR